MRIPFLSIMLGAFLFGIWAGMLILDQPMRWERVPVAPAAVTPSQP